MDFYRELQNTNFNDLFERLVGYASSRLKSVNIRTMDGKEPCDLVAEILEKVLTGVRNAENARCSLKEFLFGCLRSDIDAFFNRNKISCVQVTDGISATESVTETAKQSNTSREHYVSQLRNVGADDQEIAVFNLWAEGVTKPAEIGTELELPATTIYKIKRRLLRHLEEIRKKTNAFV